MLKTIADILVAQGIITAEQVTQAEQAAHKAQTTLANYLVAQNLVTPAQLAQAYAEQLNLREKRRE